MFNTFIGVETSPVLEFPGVGLSIVGQLVLISCPEPCIDGTDIQFFFRGFCSEQIEHQAHHEELGSQPHFDETIEGRTWRQLEVIKGSQQQNGNRSEGQRQGDVFSLLHGRCWELNHHAVTHECHVGDQQPREEPLRVQHGS